MIDFSREFHPAPKSVSKPRRKGKAKIPKKRKKKAETYKGRVIPSARVRGQISKREYERMIEEFGSACIICGSPYIEAHHLRFRSQGGRGKWRNLAPLCKEHHMQAHSDRKFADRLREEREKMYGSWYWADEYDLFKTGLIPNTTKEAFEKYMEGEEERARLARMATESNS